MRPPGDEDSVRVTKYNDQQRKHWTLNTRACLKRSERNSSTHQARMGERRHSVRIQYGVRFQDLVKRSNPARYDKTVEIDNSVWIKSPEGDALWEGSNYIQNNISDRTPCFSSAPHKAGRPPS